LVITYKIAIAHAIHVQCKKRVNKIDRGKLVPQNFHQSKFILDSPFPRKKFQNAFEEIKVDIGTCIVVDNKFHSRVIQANSCNYRWFKGS